MGLNKSNKTPEYVLGRLYGLAEYLADILQERKFSVGEKIAVDFQEYPARYFAEVAKETARMIGGVIDDDRMLEQEMEEIMGLIDPTALECMGSDKPIPVENQGMIVLGRYHEKSFLYKL